MVQHRIVITRHRPWMKAAAIGGSAALIAVGGFSLYAYTRQTTVSDFEKTRTELEQLREERRTLARQLRSARAENSELREQVVYAERSSQIDAQACASVRESLATLQAEAADLREQVAFYRGIVSPDESRAGVRVLDLKMIEQAQPGVWRFDLVLIQSVRHDRRVSGAVEIRLIGSQSGQPRTLEIKDLMVGNEKPPAFAFKYFQEFSGDFRLPEGFRPLRVAVTLAPDGHSSPRVEQEYEWSKIQTGRAKP